MVETPILIDVPRLANLEEACRPILEADMGRFQSNVHACHGHIHVEGVDQHFLAVTAFNSRTLNYGNDYLRRLPYLHGMQYPGAIIIIQVEGDRVENFQLTQAPTADQVACRCVLCLRFEANI